MHFTARFSLPDLKSSELDFTIYADVSAPCEIGDPDVGDGFEFNKSYLIGETSGNTQSLPEFTIPEGCNGGSPTYTLQIIDVEGIEVTPGANFFLG